MSFFIFLSGLLVGLALACVAALCAVWLRLGQFGLEDKINAVNAFKRQGTGGGVLFNPLDPDLLAAKEIIKENDKRGVDTKLVDLIAPEEGDY